MVKAEFRGVVTGLAAVGSIVLIAISVDLGVPGQALLQTIRFHLATAMLILPVLLLISGARRRAVLMLALVIMSLGQGGLIVLRQQDLRVPLAGRATLADFSLLNYNVLADNPTGTDAADLIVRTESDIAVIMEAPGIRPYFDRIGSVFPYHAGCDAPAPCDLALFSRTPLIDAQVYPLGVLRRLRFITAKTVIDGQMVTLAAVHLSKPYFDENARVELFHVMRVLRDIEGPLVVTGDFNAAAWSRALVDFVRGADLVPPPRYPSTWPVELGDFGVPIDNIFTRAPALVQDIAPSPPLGSNHRGLLARIGILATP